MLHDTMCQASPRCVAKTTRVASAATLNSSMKAPTQPISDGPMAGGNGAGGDNGSAAVNINTPIPGTVIQPKGGSETADLKHFDKVFEVEWVKVDLDVDGGGNGSGDGNGNGDANENGNGNGRSNGALHIDEPDLDARVEEFRRHQRRNNTRFWR